MSRPLPEVMDRFIAMAMVRFHSRVEVLSALDLLDYSGEDWPQPYVWTGLKRLPWEDWPSKQQITELRDRLREAKEEP